MSLFVGTIVGKTRYMEEWFTAVKHARPSLVCVVRDKGRSEGHPVDFPGLTLVDYESGVAPWESAELKDKGGWLSDESVARGFYVLYSEFLKSNCDRIVQIDSDVMIDDGAAQQMLEDGWDYLKLREPAVVRENKYGSLFAYDYSMNFGLSRELVSKLLPMIPGLYGKAYPVDLRLRALVDSLNPTHRLVVKSAYVAHYVRGRRTLLSECPNWQK